MNLVTAALELQPLIRKYLGKGEQEARLVNDVFAAVGQAGLFRLFAPHEVGGLEASPAVAFAAIEAVSAADPAVGWCIGNSQPACLAAGWLAEDERAKLFAEPNRNFGFSAAPAGRAVPEHDGYRLSGQWPVVTGCGGCELVRPRGSCHGWSTPRRVTGARAGLFAATHAVWDLASTGAGGPAAAPGGTVRLHFLCLGHGAGYRQPAVCRGTRAGFMQGNRLERALRNLHAIAFGYESSRSIQHSAGRVLLGGEPLDPLF